MYWPGLLSLVIPLAAWIRGVPYVDAGAHGCESRHRRTGGDHSHLGRYIRHRLEAKSPQLPAAPSVTWASRGSTTGSDWSFLLSACLGIWHWSSPFLVVLVVWLARMAHSPLNGAVGGIQGRAAIAIRDTIDSRCRGVAQSGSASALGAEGRGFESLRPDHDSKHTYMIFCFSTTADCGRFVGTSKSELTTSNTATARRFASARTWL